MCIFRERAVDTETGGAGQKFSAIDPDAVDSDFSVRLSSLDLILTDIYSVLQTNTETIRG